MKSLLNNRVFRIVMISDLLQQLAIWTRNMALLYFVVDVTNGSAVAISLLTVAEFAPIFIFSVIGGVLADRWRPKHTMIWGDILSFLSVLLIFVAVNMGYWKAVFITAVVSAIASQFSQPSSMKIFKQHIPSEQTDSAIAIAQSLASLFIILGPIIGTAIYFSLGLQTSLLSLLFIFGASAFVLTFLPASQKQQVPIEQRTSLGTEWMEGFRYVRNRRSLMLLFFLLSGLALAAGLVQPLEIFLVTERLQLEERHLQWLTAAAGVGMLIGSLLAAIPAMQRFPRQMVMFAGLVMLGSATIIEAMSVWPMLTIGMRLITGIFMAFMQTVIAASLLKIVDAAFIGRVNSFFVPIFTGFLLLGTAASGWLTENTSLLFVFCVSGSLLLLTAFMSLRLRLERDRLPS